MENISQKLRLFIWKTQVPPLRTVSRFLWIFLSGWSLFLLYAGAAVALVPTGVGLIFLPKMLQIAFLALDPIDKELVYGAGRTTISEKILDGLWLVLFGWEIFLFHLLLALVQILTIYGIGNAVRHYQIAVATLLPYGKEVVPRRMPPRPS